MQRTENNFVIISCDFCGSDWDEVKPMIEGHHGSILCLDCLKLALTSLNLPIKPPRTTSSSNAKASAPDSSPSNSESSTATFHCTLCLQDHPHSTPHWSPNPRPPASNPHAIACIDCIKQAAGAFHSDKDTDWKWT